MEKHIYQSIRVLSLKAYWWFYRVKYAVLKVQCRKFEPYFPVFSGCSLALSDICVNFVSYYKKL